MRKNFKQIISIFIAVFMVTAMVPAYSFAETAPAMAEEQATERSTADSLQLSVDGKTYTGWSNAMTAAETAKKKVVTLVSNGILPAGQYVIPDGVTLLIPFDEKATLYTTEPECYLYYWSQPSAYRTLTLETGAELVVNGALSVAAPHTPVMGYLENGGSPYSAYGHINMKEGSNITVNYGGSLYAYGYITGDGEVTAENGSEVYEYFQIMDFRGGRATTHLLDAKYEDEDGNKTPYEIFPFSQYYVQNIEVPLTVEYGAREYGYTSVYAGESVTSARIGLIGPNEDTLFKMQDGTVTKLYDGSKDRIMITVSGNVELDSIVLKECNYTVDSAEYVMPINSNMTIVAASGTLSIVESFALLPGAELNIDQGAVCKMNDGSSLYVYDSAQWGKFTNIYGEKFNDVNFAPGRTYVRTEAELTDASVQVAGTLDGTAGYIYTTGTADSKDGARIYGQDSGVIKLRKGTAQYTWQFEYVGPETVDTDYGNYHKIPVTTAKLYDSNGEYTQPKSGIYIYSNGGWSTECDHDYVEHKAQPATCTEPGWDDYQVCLKCGYSTYVEIPAGVHQYGEEQYVTPTAKVTGGWYQECTVCKDKKWIKKQQWLEYLSESTAATEITATALADMTTEDIVVSWTKNSDFALNKYKVYRSTTGKDGSFKQVAETTVTKYVDKNAKVGITYYYYVVGVKVYGSDVFETVKHNTVSAIMKKVTAAQVKAIKATVNTEYAAKGIKIKCSSPKIRVDGYQIWRSDKLNGKYKLVKTTKNSVKNWTNTNLKLQKRYYYKVRGYKVINGKKVFTKFSVKSNKYVLNARNAKLANAIDKKNAVTVKKAVKANNGIKVTWSKKKMVKCNEYEVWRATSKNGKYTKIATISKPAGVNTITYNDKSKKLEKGKRYYYKVVGYRFFGKACAKTNASNIVSAVK